MYQFINIIYLLSIRCEFQSLSKNRLSKIKIYSSFSSFLYRFAKMYYAILFLISARSLIKGYLLVLLIKDPYNQLELDDDEVLESTPTESIQVESTKPESTQVKSTTMDDLCEALGINNKSPQPSSISMRYRDLISMVNCDDSQTSEESSIDQLLSTKIFINQQIFTKIY